jgi:hypothetical protein
MIKIRTAGAYAIHFYKKIDTRRIVPSGGRPMPKGIVDALQEGARRAFVKAMGGGI